MHSAWLGVPGTLLQTGRVSKATRGNSTFRKSYGKSCHAKLISGKKAPEHLQSMAFLCLIKEQMFSHNERKTETRNYMELQSFVNNLQPNPKLHRCRQAAWHPKQIFLLTMSKQYISPYHEKNSSHSYILLRSVRSTDISV